MTPWAVTPKKQDCSIYYRKVVSHYDKNPHYKSDRVTADHSVNRHAPRRRRMRGTGRAGFWEHLPLRIWSP